MSDLRKTTPEKKEGVLLGGKSGRRIVFSIHLSFEGE